jgi:hypothetical protein
MSVWDRNSPPSDATIRAALVATGFEYCDSIWWRQDDDGGLRLLVHCSDLFAWGTADCEEITDTNVETFVATFTECHELMGQWNAQDAHLLWCCRQRGQRPQGAYYKHLDEALRPLFDAAGPEREVSLLNPHERPKPTAREELE